MSSAQQQPSGEERHVCMKLWMEDVSEILDGERDRLEPEWGLGLWAYSGNPEKSPFS